MHIQLKNVLSARSHKLLSRNCAKLCETGLFSPHNGLDFSPRPMYLEQFPASRGAQLQKITASTLSMSSWAKYDYDLGWDRKKRAIFDEIRDRFHM